MGCHLKDRIRVFALLLPAALSPALPADLWPVDLPASFLSPTEREVLQEMNRVREDPVRYASLLEALRGSYRGKLLELPGQVPIRTQEGVKALEEAIRALRRSRPARPLAPSPGMSLAARNHVRDLGRTGRVSHEGTDGSDVLTRLRRHGTVERAAGENLAFGAGSGRQVVIQLLVDDGVPDRGHRKNMLDPTYRVAGVACGPHPSYGSMCAMDFAGGFVEKRGRRRG